MKYPLAFAATLALAAPAAATTVTLDFSGDICTTADRACIDRSPISQDYGDIAGQVDVIYDAARTVDELQPLLFWSTGYETLTGVAYGVNEGGGLSITLAAMTGFRIALQGFDIAPFADRVKDTLVQVIDIEDGAIVFDDGYSPLSTEVVTSLRFIGFTSAFGFRINLGPDAFDVGIDNIVFSVTPIETNGGPTDPVDPVDPSVIPLPASAFLLLGALGGIGLLRRRTART
jgi:hypothetical protein